MGTWGITVTQNDQALDDICGMEYIDPQGITMGFITELLLFSSHDESVVLGAQMVLSSYKRTYNPNDYTEFFDMLWGNKKIQHHKRDAIARLDYLINKGVDNWREELRIKRLEYLKGMKERLENARTN